jgi:hypothetical protein
VSALQRGNAEIDSPKRMNCLRRGLNLNLPFVLPRRNLERVDEQSSSRARQHVSRQVPNRSPFSTSTPLSELSCSWLELPEVLEDSDEMAPRKQDCSSMQTSSAIKLKFVNLLWKLYPTMAVCLALIAAKRWHRIKELAKHSRRRGSCRSPRQCRQWRGSVVNPGSQIQSA